MDTADAAGDLFFDLMETFMYPLNCPYGPSTGGPFCANAEVTAPDLVVTKLTMEVDTTRFGCVRLETAAARCAAALLDLRALLFACCDPCIGRMRCAISAPTAPTILATHAQMTVTSASTVPLAQLGSSTCPSSTRRPRASHNARKLHLTSDAGRRSLASR